MIVEEEDDDDERFDEKEKNINDLFIKKANKNAAFNAKVTIYNFNNYNRNQDLIIKIINRIRFLVPENTTILRLIVGVREHLIFCLLKYEIKFIIY